MIALASDDDTYALPAGLVRIVAVGRGGQVLSALAPEDMIQESFNESGDPLFYVVEGSNIRVAPTPSRSDEELYVVYVRPENVLTTDSDTVLAPDIYEDIIVVYAAIHQASRLKDQQLISTLEMLRKQTLESAKRDVLKTSRAPRLQVRDDV